MIVSFLSLISYEWQSLLETSFIHYSSNKLHNNEGYLPSPLLNPREHGGEHTGTDPALQGLTF